MAFPVDDEKLDRVRRRMDADQMDALLVRAPDNVLYLTNYWPMKGYACAVFPRHGQPVLAVIEPQLNEARRDAWPTDIRTFPFYHPSDPRPPTARSLDLALDVLREMGIRGRVGIELSQGTQICDRMVGEPTVFTWDYFQTCRRACREMGAEMVDAVPLLTWARMIKTPQEIERMVLANELATLGLKHVQDNIEPGMSESRVAGLIEGHIHEIGVGYKGQVEMARAFSLVWSGPGIATFTATGNRPVQKDQPTLIELWVAADGYWTDLTKNLCPEPPRQDYERLLELLLSILDEAVDSARPGNDLGEMDRLIRDRLAQGGYPGQPSHPVVHGVGARAHEPPFGHAASPFEIRAGMVLAIEPGAYWPQGGGLRLEDNYLVGEGRPQKLCSFPDDFRAAGR